MNQTTILIVDDDPSINELLQSVMQEEGWKTNSAVDGDQAIKSFHENLPDLVILDIMMPGIDGVEVCRHIADTSSVPIIMLSALSALDDKVRCLDVGADDYITKPFQTRELIARVKAALRRHHQENGVPGQNLFTSGDLEIDFGARSVKVRGAEVRLTHHEYCLLEELALNPGKALTYEHLLLLEFG